MIQDYSRRYASGGRRQKVRRRNRAPGNSDSGLLWKAVGVFVSFAAVVGVAASLWLGWQIDSGLDELNGALAVRQEAQLRNRALLASRDHLQSREQVEVTAAGLGLYPPTSRQVRRP